MAARKNQQIKTRLNKTSSFVEALAENARSLESDSEELHNALNELPSITKGRTFEEIVLDDALDHIAKVSAILELNITDFDRDSIPGDVYHKILEMRSNSPVSKASAEKKLNDEIQVYVNKIKKTGAVNPLPDSVDLAYNTNDTELKRIVHKNWEKFIDVIADSFYSAEALVSRTLKQSLTNGLKSIVSPEDKKFLTQGQTSKTVAPGKMDPELDKLLQFFGEDVTLKATSGDLPEISGRDSEAEQTLATLIKRQNPYSLNHGPAGSGVTAVTQAIAQRIVEGKVPASLKDAKIIRLKFREMKANDGNGQKKDPITGNPMGFNVLNDRLRTILEKVSEHNAKGGPQIILNLTELNELDERFPLSQSKNILATAMDETNNLKIIAEISDEQKYKIEAGSGDFLDLFTPTPVKPLGSEQAVTVLRQSLEARSPEEREGVTDALLNFIVEKSDRYISGVAQPKSGLKILDSAIAIAQVRGEALEKGHIAEVISMSSGIPKEFIDSSLSKDIATLAEKLPQKIMGQDESMARIAASLEDANEGINDPNKPLGVFFMPGATGVGKTYTAETLADLLHMPLITIDMGNYQDKHAKAKLIGAPPGYVGYSDTPEMQKVTPFSVVLLDEFEKAHPEVQNIFLSAFDKGRLQLLNNGKEIDLRNCVVFMTSNLGAREASNVKDKGTAAFGMPENVEETNQKLSRDVIQQRIREELSPEFLNRVTVLYYNDLNEDVVRRIAMREINKVSEFLQSKNENLTLSLTKEAIDDLMSIGFDPKFGARPMERAALENLKRPVNAWYKANATDISVPTEIRVTSLKDEFKAEAVKLSADKKPGSNDNQPPKGPSRQNGPGGLNL